LRTALPGFRLLVVGAGEQDGELRAEALRIGLAAALIQAGQQPYARLPDLVSIAMIGLLPFQVNDITRDIIPIKVLQYLACGRPVVAAPLRETWARSSSPPVTERVTPATSETTAQSVSSA